MAETLALDTTLTKAEQYRQLLPQIEALTTGEPDLVANLANTAAALRQAFGFFWVGFYLVKGEELVLGPFQGPIACTRIRQGKGVCGASWARAETILAAAPGSRGQNGRCHAGSSRARPRGVRKGYGGER